MSEKNGHQDEAAEKPQTPDLNADKAMSEEELLAAIDEESADVSETQPSGEGFSNPMEALAAENTRQEEEIKDLKDKLLRTVAEMENLRRRTQKDVADARDYSISKFARDVLGVADNLRRAIDHVAEEDKAQAGLKSLVEGVEMTERELLSAMEKNGVKKIDPLGEKFDPNFHQAMFEVPNPEVPNNSIAQVVQVGYVIGERVLRPAMVGVAKGGPKVAEEPSEKDTENQD